MEVAELFNHLESNQPQTVEQIKKSFHEHFNATKESWLVAGLYDYYIHTSSIRSVEILVGVREPHDKHLFDRITEGLRSSSKLQALTLLGHVVRKQPAWLYKITNNPLMKELIKLLKAETDILPLMSALLVLIILLPMIPALIGPYLPDIFDIFSRLAAWKCTNPNKFPEEHLLHLQVALIALFHRLYGMYPCNFLSYLRLEYSKHENLGTFSHTIKPMLDTVKMHPLLVIQSKEGETAALRWKKMEHHDVILECAKFAIEAERSSFRSCTIEYQGTSSLEASYHNQQTLALNPSTGENDLWSPSIHCGFLTPPPQETAATPIPQTPNLQQSYIISTSLPHQEGTSPPEAAIEATPETTPIKDMRNMVGRPTPVNSNVVRALNTFANTKWPGVTSQSSTPSQSQPSSPMKKEPTPFQFPSESSTPTSAFEQPRRDSLFQASDPRRDVFMTQKVQKVLQDRSQMAVDSPPIDKLTMNLRPKSSGIPPTSPLRMIGPNSPCVPNSPIPMDPTAPVPGGKVSRPTPEKNGFQFDSVHDSTQEDQEVFDIVRKGEQLRTVNQRQCDSVLQEIHPSQVDDYEECQQDSGSPCTSGGLHMPNSRSMLDFARKVALQHRQRFYSQCIPEPACYDNSFSTGSIPGEGSALLQQFHVRRTNSCPDMKKVPTFPTGEIVKSKTLHEREELECINDEDYLINGKVEEALAVTSLVTHMVSTSTQTVNHWVLPYEHLFLEVLPTSDSEMTPYSAPSVSPHSRFSPYAMLDKYIDTFAQAPQSKVQSSEQEVLNLKDQIFLLNIQLQFERHRREVHAERNRRLLGKSRSTRAMEEHNSALREQLSLLQTDIEQLHNGLEKKKRDNLAKEQYYKETIEYWQLKYNTVQKEAKDLKINQQMLEQETKHAQEKTATSIKECRQVEKKFVDVVNDMHHAMAQASAGEQLRNDVEHLQKELLLMGEIQQRYREQAAQLPLLRRHDDDQVALLRDSSKAEIIAIHEVIDSKNSLLDAARARVNELEGIVARRDMLITEQKRSLKQVKEEYHDRLEAVESKYKTHRAINQRMEEQVILLSNQLEEAERFRISRSPDSSAQEVSISVSSAGSAAGRLLGFSPPLHESIRLGEKLPQALFAGDEVGMKNLQIIVEQSEQVSRLQQTNEARVSDHLLLDSVAGSSTLGEG